LTSGAIRKEYSQSKNLTRINGGKTKMEKEKAVVILSGGMDSTTLLYDVVKQGKDAYVLSFNYGQKHSKELDMAWRTTMKLDLEHKIVDLTVLNQLAPSALTRKDWQVPTGHYADENMKQTVVPNRNMVMLSLATAYAIGLGAKEIFYGAHAGDHAIYPDCRPEFVEKLGDVIKIADWTPVELKAPYLKLDKGDIAIKGRELKVDYSLTWTCYKGEDLACGDCGSCSERLEAFDKASMKDPIKYQVKGK
jgi:7-cyano-7-deazaguanine synthase